MWPKVYQSRELDCHLHVIVETLGECSKVTQHSSVSRVPWSYLYLPSESRLFSLPLSSLSQYHQPPSPIPFQYDPLHLFI